MSYPARRTIVVKARWDSVVLVVAATALTYGLAATIHSRTAGSSSAAQTEWTGDLTEVDPGQVPPALPLTSASLVVSSSDLALPHLPVRALVKFRSCGGSVCSGRGATPAPIPRPASVPAVAITRQVEMHGGKPTLMSRLNPLNHLPDVTKISRPFTMAGDTVQGWFKRF